MNFRKVIMYVLYIDFVWMIYNTCNMDFVSMIFNISNMDFCLNDLH